MAPFYGLCSTASIPFGEAVYFLPLSFLKFLVLILSTTEGSKVESTLEPPSGFEHAYMHATNQPHHSLFFLRYYKEIAVLLL